jgi:hypothetical protein
VGELDFLLVDFDPDELRRVVNEARSFCERINEVLVVEVSLIQEMAAEARNADKTAALVSNFSRIRSHRLIDRISFTDGTR